jgi:hypothetical protein
MIPGTPRRRRAADAPPLDGVRRRPIAVDDAVPEAARRPDLHRAIVGVDHPLDGAVADGVRAHGTPASCSHLECLEDSPSVL